MNGVRPTVVGLFESMTAAGPRSYSYSDVRRCKEVLVESACLRTGGVRTGCITYLILQQTFIKSKG